jgi:hypothetical protein
VEVCEGGLCPPEAWGCVPWSVAVRGDAGVAAADAALSPSPACVGVGVALVWLLGADEVSEVDRADAEGVSAVGATLERNATLTFVAPALSDGAATASDRVVVSGEAVAGAAEIAGCTTGSSELARVATDDGPAGGDVAPLGAAGADAVGADRFWFAGATIWAGAATREEGPSGRGVAATKSLAPGESASPEASKAVNASPALSTSAPGPSCAALTPAEPVEVRRAAELVRIPNMATGDPTRVRGGPARHHRQSNPCAKSHVLCVSVETLQFPRYFSRRGGAGPEAGGHFCRPRPLRTQFLPTSASHAFLRPPFDRLRDSAPKGSAFDDEDMRSSLSVCRQSKR